MDKPSDQEIIRQITEENKDLFSEVIERYQKPLFRYIYRLGHFSSDECEDILQETFIKVYKNLRAFDLKRKFSSWIYRIAHNETINYIKKRKKEVSLEENNFDEVLPDNTDLFQELEVKEKFKKVKKEIYKLEIKYREVLILRYFQQKSYEEISDILRKPVNTVGTLISRAKKNLKENLS